MTNREWINSLSDEQLVKLMRLFKDDSCCMCVEQDDEHCGYCFDNQVEWLSMEYEDRWEERDYRYSFW